MLNAFGGSHPRLSPMLMNASTCSTFRPAVIAPTFNNDKTLRDLLDRLDRLALPVFVVDDGSTDSTRAILAEWVAGRTEGPSDATREVCFHLQNRGKAAALQRGFIACRDGGFTHAVSIDTDGQHSPDDIPLLLAVAEEHPQSLVLGARDEHSSDYPFRSRWGRRISNLLVRLECGQRVEDSQCGLRVYPLAEVEPIRCGAGRYGFETEVITRARWNQVPVLSARVSCRYLPADQRVSHFKPWVDSTLAMAMHARLLMRSLSPWVSHPSAGKATLSIGVIRRRIRQSMRQSIQGINPFSAWRTVRHDAIGRTDFAIGFAIGVFIANLPLYGAQTLSGLFAARRLHLNSLSVIAGTQLSMPPIGPLLIAAAVVVGHLLLHGNVPAWSLLQTQLHGHIAGLLGSMLLDWLIGSVCVGGVLAIAAFISLRLVLNAAFGRRAMTVDHWPAVSSPSVAGNVVGSAE